MVPLTCMAVLMAAGTLVVPVASQDSPPCPWLISSDSGCVESVECTADGDGIYIWEDCSVGDALFTINDPEVSLNDCAYASGSPIVYLTKELDAEDPANPSCTVQGRPELFFIAVNINEVSPRATKDTVPIIEVYVDENKKVSTAEQIYYTDDDKDETINLSCTQIMTTSNAFQISQGYSDIFSLTPVDGVENNIKTFTFSVNKKLDYESQVFYKMEYNIISTDEKGNKMNTKQTFFVYVNDLPDNAPFWSDIEPVWKLSECQPEVTIVTILDCNDQWPTFDKETYRITMDELTEDSKDQDLDVQIKVQDMDEGDNGSFTLTTSNAEFLGITPNGKQSQDVTLTAKWLSDNNNYFNYEIHKSKPFNFKITATEDGEPSHTTTATVTITLRDVNDNSPIFHSSPYTTSIKESKPMNSVLLTVEAEDDDVRDDFGKPSIRYSLELSCHQLKIDNTTGIVTLASELDYDGINPDKEINCNVNARDNNGTGLSGTSKIIISVIDVVDEIPWIQDSEILMTIKENSAQGADVGTFIVNDLDQAANINFTIVSSVCSSGTSGPTDVDGWFSVVSGPPSNPQYPAQVKVTGHIDREACREVTLNVMAVDWETDANEDSVNVNVVITVQDVKDEAPQFTGDYGDLSIDEMTEAATGSVVVFLLTVSDPDEGDTIHLAISKGAEQMELSETSVTVEEGGEAKVDVRTKKDTIIDRETHEYIEVEITLTNDEHQPTQHRTFTIKINDLNDNTPEMTSDSCDVETIHVLEDDGTGSVNGTSIHNITAIDDDIDSPFNTVSYLMVNDQLTDSKNLQTPFTVDELTGEVRVLLIPDKKSLNREQYTDWELIFTAADRCRQPQELNCKVLQSDQCRVKITVDDINDNDPRNLVWTPQGKITVTDFLQEDEDIGYTLSATDDDVGKNATLTYTVLSTVPLHGNEDRMLFYTKNQHIGGKAYTSHLVSCYHSLHGSQDFKGKNYTGTYNVTLQAMDGGNRTAEFPIDIIVEDANDQTPEFVFYGCEGELNVNTIKMDENAYKPGVENNPDFMEVKCYSPKGPTFTIGVQDDDFMDKNKELSLHVINTAEPHLESWGWVRVVIKNIQEDDPYFCPDGSCYQDVYMYENIPKAEIYFKEATDKDNIFAHPGDDEYDLVYYYIVGNPSFELLHPQLASPKILYTQLIHPLENTLEIDEDGQHL
ncbi:Protein dachsous [Chionoecetes opilio]|uniref:Protein dachsous n=1 Tax=Chionoecetes opilio TaxID=41210 RepID=A0A8J5CR17_CHIOP|nr:Protein dachsous [Chionoecetes opilio]